jgi:N-acetylglucosamine-6-sulfatase
MCLGFLCGAILLYNLRLRHALTLLCAAFLLLLVTVSCVQSGRVKTKRPNIILIVTDDQNADTIAFMPNLQRLLVDGGTSFSEAYSPTPLCCPGRASILRGQYAHNHGVRSNDGINGGFPKFYDTGNESSTLATWLQEEGYHTALVGKYFNAYPESLVPPDGFRSPGRRYIPPGWSEWYGLVDIPRDSRANPYAMYGYEMNQNSRLERYGNDEDDYLTDVLGDLAVDFVELASRRNKPFFLYLAPTAPHLPAIPAPRHLGMFDEIEAPRSPAFNETDVSDKPAWVSKRKPLTGGETGGLDRMYRRQAEMLLSLDEVLGSLVDTLRARGEIASTYIVFTSDHGLHFGEHRLLRTKLTPYRASARVPLVIRGPRVPKGRTVGELALLSDIAPTLMALAKVPTPAFVDGRSLIPWVKNNAAQTKAREQVLLEFWPREGFPVDEREEPEHVVVQVPEYRALRSKRYLYTEYLYPGGGEERELYDLRHDPFELENIAGTANASLLRSFSRKLDELQACQAESCRKAEDSALVDG